MNIKKILITLAVIAMAGCASKPELKPVVDVLATKNVVTLVAPPDTLVKSCVVNTPPDKADYLASDDQVKEQLLIDYTKKLLTSLRVCNKDIGILRNWIKEQIDINTLPVK